KIAFQEAEKIHSPMKLVPVANLTEAMDYLKTMS
ncbi:MAG: hypothetical protein JWN30_1109, partial [Bacilli bacterium]|nr:hypothetical protein [Bacilli bacterium]